MIRFLSQEEKQKTRAMYEESFPQDSRQFVDYYYQDKVKDNEILVMEEAGEFQAMLHLNPFTAYTKAGVFSIRYIVAVATKAKVRGQGKMKALLDHALAYLQEQNQPFTFLMPAKPEYYYSSGFRYVHNMGLPIIKGTRKEEMSLQAAGLRVPSLFCRPLEPEASARAADFANRVLKSRYDCFIQRDEAYYLRLLEEAACQGGGILLIEREGQIIGLLTYLKYMDEIEIQEILSSTELLSRDVEDLFPGKVVGIPNRSYMAYILDAKHFRKWEDRLFRDWRIFIREEV